MGERAASRTNKMMDKLGNMYVGKNFGGHSRKFVDGYERVFGAKSVKASPRQQGQHRDITFGAGPLGMEITWSTPPVITATVAGGAAHLAGVKDGSVIRQINGRDATTPIPELELDDLMQQRPLVFRLSSATATIATDDVPDAAVGVQKLGVAKIPCALRPESCSALAAFALQERQRCIRDISEDSSLAANFFSEVQKAHASADAPQTRWDMRLPFAPVVIDALREALGSSGSALGSAFAALAGGLDAELWELGVVVSEPGAAHQPLHLDAPELCLFTSFVALQGVTAEMGPTVFLPGTHSAVAHRRYGTDPVAFLGETRRVFALLGAGDAVLYDSRVLHAGGENRSDQTRMLMYITFRHADVDAKAAGIDQHSIRRDLAGRYHLRDFMA